MNKIVKIVLWMIFFPFMLTYFGAKKRNKFIIVIGSILSLMYVVVGLTGRPADAETPIAENVGMGNEVVSKAGELIQEIDNGTTVVKELIQKVQNDEKSENESKPAVGVDLGEETLFEGYELIEVEGGDLSGERMANVVVDIGYGERKYWAFTNKHGQLEKVIAAEIILQDETSEKVNSSGRYYPDEAKVPGTEDKYLDEGHVIADSLGGVSNAYNITPQDSTLNRHGDQAYMEKIIRDAGGCQDFIAIITYPDITTQIPSHYSFTYTLFGEVINDEFDNVNPDEVKSSKEDENVEGTVVDKKDQYEGQIAKIKSLDKKQEYIVVENTGDVSIDLYGWTIVSVRGDQRFTFPEVVLEVNEKVKVGDIEKNPDVDFHWLDGNGTWNNSKSDPAEIYDDSGILIDRYEN